MICPICKGGKTLLKKVQGKGCYEVVLGICDRCHGTGEIEMTNEEWFCGLSTEEKAKFIFWQHFDVYGKTLWELMVNASKGVSRDKQAEVMIGAVVEWLKQPHTIKE